MVDHVSTLTVALIPLTTFLSLTIYLVTHADSPAKHLFKRSSIELPTVQGEPLHRDINEKDPFDLDGSSIRRDGQPVNEDAFWRSMQWRKIALLLALIPPFACNIAIMVLVILQRHDSAQWIDELMNSILLVPAHLATVLLVFAFMRQHRTASHWPTTIHLSTIISTHFLILSFLALLPSTPLPSGSRSSVPVLALFQRVDLFRFTPQSPLEILRVLLPLLHAPPLLLVLSIRRGPPLYMEMSKIYPPRITDSIPPDHSSLDPNSQNVTEEVQATVPEWLIFSYATPVIQRGYVSETMDVWDLPVLKGSMRALTQFLRMRNIYGKHQKRLGRMEGFNLLIKLAKANAGPLTAQLTLAFILAFGYYVPHYLLQLFIQYLESDPSRSNPAWGWSLAFGLFVANAAMYTMSAVIWSLSTNELQARIKLQLNTMLFSKTLVKKDVAATGDDTEKSKADEDPLEKEADDSEAVNSKAQIMTLFTVDVDRVTEFVFHGFALVDSPVEIIVATLFLVRLMGSSAIVGLLAAILTLPVNHLASKVVVTAQENLMKARDQRTALMNEILQGIRMLKFMAWERSFEERIDQIRTRELHWQARNYQIEVGFNILWAATPVLVTVVSFLHYTLVAKQHMTPSTAFTAVAVFAELRYALSALPETFIQALQGFVSCKRIEKYMSLAEIKHISTASHNGDIVLVNATFTWPRDDSADPASRGSASVRPTPGAGFTLADVSVRFPRGKLSLICGRLGSGKSLLLAGLLGEADLLAGSMECPRSSPDAMARMSDKDAAVQWVLEDLVAYVPQQAWLQNASIRDNIVFSSPWDPERYATVLEACSLLTDLEILEDGDQTEIGEKGLNLSGGQKARVSLARAVYSRAATLLLDDVLSAVDAHTAHAIMENCLQGEIMAGRTVLLVSHHTALVSPAAAFIVALENGDVRFSGTRADFVACGMMQELEAEDNAKSASSPTTEKKENPIEELAKPTHKSVASLSGAGDVQLSEPNSETSSLAPEDEMTVTSSTPDLKQKAPRKLVEDEKRATGRVAWVVWKLYFTSLGGPFWWILFSIAILITMLLPVAEKGWLENWTGEETDIPGRHSSTYYVVGYALITLLGAVLSNIEYAVMYWGSIKASRKLQRAMLESVLFAKLRFHDTTSRGRLLNRFGKDIEGLDSSMADNFARSLSYGMSVIVTFVSITYAGGWPFFAATCLILIVYYRVGSVYGQTSRDMRRLDSVTRSPMYSMFGETVAGVAVIRAFGCSTLALQQMMQLADTNMLAFVWSWTVNRWLSARFNLLSSVVVGVTAVAVLIAPGVDAAMAGFALAFANGLSHDLLFVVRRFVQLEQSMVALERIKEYSELPREAPEILEPRPPAAWPQDGEISVENLVIRYAPDLPDVLHSISFHVAPREKIGIVGSTGCGKSTLALSFFRFVEAHAGKIVIDGIDIAKIGLTDLRSRVTIIPQDPTILSGTLRSTLDVFDEYDDADIYEALRRVHLLRESDAQLANSGAEEDEARNKNVFQDLSNPVSEGGDNFSSGEKQLICMARAILKRNKLLFMDEATASIDYETDELISKTIREEFSDSTILTIAHRIHTIIDFDKVLVMDKGSIAEFASPAELLRDHRSRFYALCKATGRAEFANLKTMAMEAERKRKTSSK